MKKWVVCFFMGVWSLSPSLLFAKTPSESEKASAPRQDSVYTVWRVIDGDTLKLSNDEKVVLAGIDTPEFFLSRKLYDQARSRGEKIKNIQLKGKLATRFTRQLLEGRQVRLEFDQQTRDPHDQLLAYVYLLDGTFVNAELVKQGYAKAMIIPPNVKYKDLFLQLEKEAKDAQRGFWPYEWPIRPVGSLQNTPPSVRR